MLNVLFALLLAQIVPPSPPPLTTPSPSPAPSASPVPSPPALTASPATLGLRPGTSATVAISGATGTLSVTSGPLVTTAVDPATGAITVTAVGQLGRDVVHVVDQTGATVDVPVLVAHDAGSIPPSILLRVTGSPLDPQWLASQLASAVTRTVTVQPGATLAVSPPPDVPVPQPGASASVAVPLTIAGNGNYLDVSGTADVAIENVAVEPFVPPTLMYDDDPEHIDGDGVVDRAAVTAGAPSRLYYYHDNAADPRRLAVVLSSASASTVQVIDASAGPNIDVMSVGHAVSRDFLLAKPRNEGVIYDVAPGAPLLLHDALMAKRQGVAGSVDFNVLSGGPVTVTILAFTPGSDPLALLDGPLLPKDGHHRNGVFDITNFGNSALAYAVGGPDASIVYGDRDPTPPNVDPSSSGRDYGDYGVIHTFLFSLANPTQDPATVYLFERPIGGIVRSSFIVDGTLVDMGCVRENTTRYQVSAFSLAPNARYQLNVMTMTDGGSNYPLEVGLSTTPPSPTTPPISGPDGCFPKR
ncbi:MAG TPA: hypothetical protein VFN49_05455 [Candidatus Aquilonibacter sp.]|nr:hypothetical protein [Candidatus Aquilonibacter sp.]